jgi:hypothetical protein
MKLIIRRDQAEKKGVFGGHKGIRFILSCRVELTEKEKELIDRYKAEYHVLTWRDDGSGGQIPDLSIGTLVEGITEEIDNVATLLNNEEVIKEACKNFKTLLEVMASFGGEEVVEYS